MLRALGDMFPNAVITRIEAGEESDGYQYRTYFVENNGVRFTYENYQGKDTLFGGTRTFSQNDYCQALYEAFSQPLEDIAAEYGVEYDLWSTELRLINRVSRMENLERGLLALEEVYALLEAYIPRTEVSWFQFQLALVTQYGPTQTTRISSQPDWDPDVQRQLLYLNFKADVEEGLVDAGLAEEIWNNPELLRDIPQKYIRTLYIDGERYTSERYETLFLYNLADGAYYTTVCFGTELDYNGGVEDYLQREIIEARYPDADYTISNQDGTSTYWIGADQYTVTDGSDGLRFQKNGMELPIDSYSEISGTRTRATYYYWLHVDDFAAIMGMVVDKVTEDGVYLSTWDASGPVALSVRPTI